MSKNDLTRVLYNSNDIANRVKELAQQIEADYATKTSSSSDGGVVLVGVLTGAIHFISDLSRALSIPHQLDFVSVSSYEGTSSTGSIVLRCDTKMSLKDKHVIIVEDIVDTGLTMVKLIEHIRTNHSPKSIEVAVLLTKPTQLEHQVECRYVKFFEFSFPSKLTFLRYIGFALEKPTFVVGYGLDYNEHFRGVEYIGIPTEEAIKKYANNK